MDSEAKIILAFLFNRSGKTMLTEAELYLPLSMELGWFSTKDAQEFIASAIQQKLIIKKEKLLHPNFPIEHIIIPVGFTPSKKIVDEKKDEQKEGTFLESIITQIWEKTKRDQKDIEKEIQQEAQEKKILPEVAALSVAWKYGVDITEWFEVVETQLLKGNIG